MNKELIKNIKVFAASALLAGSIVLSGCSSSTDLSDYTDEEIKEEYERRSEEKETFDSKTKVFEPGEHILQIIKIYYPLETIGIKSVLECPEGYEIISSWSIKGNDYKYIGYIYRNTESVEVKSDENGEFTDFGSPLKIEAPQKVKTKK